MSRLKAARKRALRSMTALSDFEQSNRDRDAASVAIEHAQSVLPGLRNRHDALVARRRELLAADDGSKLIAAIPELEAAVRHLLSLNTVAQEIIANATRDLGEGCAAKYALPDICFTGRATLDGLASWRNFVNEETNSRRTSRRRRAPRQPQSSFRRLTPTAR